MDRRRFLRSGTGTLAAGAMVAATEQQAVRGDASPSGPAASSPAQADAPVLRPSLMRDYSEDDHRARLRNIAIGTKSIRRCLRRHLVTDYLPAQCCYNLGEYPSQTPWKIDAHDEQELDRLRALGIQVLQVFDDWNDSLRLFGRDKYSAVNPEGYRRFLQLAHQRGMKVLTYTSTCFLQRSDPDFRREWSREGDYLVVGYWDMARCSPASPGWRSFVLKKLIQVLDEYGADGLYIDGGYLANQHAAKRAMPPAADELPAFEETEEHDGAFGDLLALIYAEVKRRGGIVKLHVNGAEAPRANGLKTYDYLWVGEGVAQVDALRQSVKNHEPYLVPCIDMGFSAIESVDEPYLHSIPYLQFPVAMGGRVFTGERGFVPGVKYQDDFWLKRCRDARRQYRENPALLHTYSAWDEVPGSPLTRTTYGKWLKRYLPLVEEGTRVWMEISDSNLFAAAPPPNVVVSAFANRRFQLVLANYGRSPANVQTTDSFVSVDNLAHAPRAQWLLPPRSLLILERRPPPEKA